MTLTRDDLINIMKVAHMAALMGRCSHCGTLPEGVFCEDCIRQHELLVDSLSSAKWKPALALDADNALGVDGACDCDRRDPVNAEKPLAGANPDLAELRAMLDANLIVPSSLVIPVLDRLEEENKRLREALMELEEMAHRYRVALYLSPLRPNAH